MHPRCIAHVIGTLLIVIAGSLLFPLVVTLFYDENDFQPILISMLVILALGLPLRFLIPKDYELNIRDAVVIAVFGWIIICAVSTFPFLFSGAIPSFTDAFFEMMSGYTTTGATILKDIEALDHGLLIWRSETHFLGGMGFLALTMIFLPHGMSGVHLSRAESSPGQMITNERVIPRNRDALLWVWIAYTLLNLLNGMLLWLGGMSWFDSICHAFSTVATAGYSPKNASMGHYGSAYFDWVTIVFMFLGGVTFMLYYHMQKGHWEIVGKNTELRWYAGIVLFFCALVTLILWSRGTYPNFLDALRHGAFQVVSLLTTTGLTTADYELWPQSAQMYLYTVCFIGACAGSTTSGIKIVHYVILLKHLKATMLRFFIQPRFLSKVILNGQKLDEKIIHIAFAYFIINMFLVVVGGCLIVLLNEIDLRSALSSVVSTLMNVGPGFGSVGPSENYQHLSDASKWLLSWLMLVGRLEMFTALVVLYPAFWKNGSTGSSVK